LLLGFRLIKRGERKENKVNMLNKTNDGKIYYNEKMSEKGWKTVVKKKFEPETLTWTDQYNF
jgi:ribosomal protein L24E